MEDGKLLLCDDGAVDGVEKVKPLPAGSFRRLRTLPPELDLSVENGGRPLRCGPFANGLRHHHSDESDYRPLGAGAEGVGAPGGSRYTSLRDLLPSHSPTAAAAAWPHEGEISIRNRLVKQAAYAYLQPMAAVSPGSAPGRGEFHRWIGCDDDGCFGVVRALLVPAVRGALRQVFERFRRMFGTHDR